MSAKKKSKELDAKVTDLHWYHHAPDCDWCSKPAVGLDEDGDPACAVCLVLTPTNVIQFQA